MNRTYMTPSRRAVLSLFCSHPHRQFTAEQVCTLLCKTNEDGTALLGKSTVYRQLSKLCEGGQLTRTTAVDDMGGAVNVYRYAPLGEEQTSESHFRLQCRLCGRVTPLDCKQINTLISHLREQHGFAAEGDTVLGGVCRECRKHDEKED